jgi:rhodanese-related sulfurtransferase
VVAGLAALYIGYKYFQRHRLLNELRMARITVDELRQKQEAGENPVILDLRSHDELDQNPSLIRGALHMTLDEVQLREQEIPRDREIVLYCSCPNEVSSARAALLLHRKGILRVRPLLGGIDAWRERNYPMELRAIGAASALGAGSGGQERQPLIQILIPPENKTIKTEEDQSDE